MTNIVPLTLAVLAHYFINTHFSGVANGFSSFFMIMSLFVMIVDNDPLIPKETDWTGAVVYGLFIIVEASLAWLCFEIHLMLFWAFVDFLHEILLFGKVFNNEITDKMCLRLLQVIVNISVFLRFLHIVKRKLTKRKGQVAI